MKSEARLFLRELFGNKPEELHMLLWTLADKRSRWFTDVESAASTVEASGPQGVYVGVGLAKRDYGPGRRCPSEEIAGLVGFWADFDIKSEAHSDKRLPSSIDEALTVIPSEFPPTIIVITGNGAHTWWLFKEPWVFETPDERRRAMKQVLRWQTFLRLNAASRGWAFDRLADLARVLRVPGTVNNKDPEKPKPVHIMSRSERRYNQSDFEDYLDELRIPGTEEQREAMLPGSAQVTDQPLVLDQSAALPEDLLQRFMEADPRFKQTWLRQRDDLQDQSPSGYDLALANFGYQAGLTDQQIVNLLVHHRRKYAQRPRTRLDYFHRTLSKARSQSMPSTTLPVEPEQAANHDGAATSEQPLDPAHARALLCEHISHILGVRILRIRKITGKEPSYQVELENTTIELSSVGELIDQKKLRVAIAAGVNRLIPRVKPKDWEGVAQMMLDALTETDGGEETDLRGSTRMYVDQYLRETIFIDTIDGQPTQVLRNPTVINGQIAICASNLQLYIVKTLNQNVSVKGVASMLAAIGATSERVRGAGFREQSRWLLPVGEFDPAQYVASAEEGAHATPA